MPVALLTQQPDNWWRLTVPSGDRALNSDLRAMPGVKWVSDERCRYLPWDAKKPVDTILSKHGYIIRETTRPALVPGALPPIADEFPLSSYQRRAINSTLTPGSTLLAWEMGAGKTLTALLAMKLLKKATLIVAPAHVVPNWEMEQEKWDLFQSNQIPFMITSYTQLATASLLPNTSDALIILDEAHYIKNPTSKRTRTIRQLVATASHVLALTGTAMPNNTMELYALMSVLYPGHFGSKSCFAMHYAGAVLKTIPAGPMEGKQCLDIPKLVDISPTKRAEICKLKELSDRFCLLADVVTSKDIEHHLPELNISKHTIPVEAETKQQIDYMYGAIQDGNRKMRGPLLDLAAEIKTPEVLRLVREADRGATIAIFTWRKQFGRDIEAFLQHPTRQIFRLNGDCLPTTRFERIQEAKNHSAVTTSQTVMVCTIDAVQTGLDLSFCDRVIFAELVYVPAKISQSIKRFHRRGQLKNVEVTFLAAEDTLDERVIDINLAKIDAIQSVTGAADTAGLFADALQLDEEEEMISLLKLLGEV